MQVCFDPAAALQWWGTITGALTTALPHAMELLTECI
jgi:hypothetical protein